MMKRKALLVVVCVLMLGALAVSSAQAGQWYTCTVNQAGTSFGSYFLFITDTAAPTPAFTNRMFFIDTSAGNQKSMLASALTAWSTGGKLNVWLDSPSEFFTTPAVTVTN